MPAATTFASVESPSESTHATKRRPCGRRRRAGDDRSSSISEDCARYNRRMGVAGPSRRVLHSLPVPLFGLYKQG